MRKAPKRSSMGHRSACVLEARNYAINVYAACLILRDIMREGIVAALNIAIIVLSLKHAGYAERSGILSGLSNQ